MEITGRIHEIKNTELVGKNGFPKRKIVLNRSRQIQYSDQIIENYSEITFLGEEKCKLPDGFSVGDVVKCQIDISGNYYNNQEGEKRFSQEVNSWKIELVRKSENPSTPPNESNFA